MLLKNVNSRLWLLILLTQLSISLSISYFNKVSCAPNNSRIKNYWNWRIISFKMSGQAIDIISSFSFSLSSPQNSEYFYQFDYRKDFSKRVWNDSVLWHFLQSLKIHKNWNFLERSSQMTKNDQKKQQNT